MRKSRGIQCFLLMLILVCSMTVGVFADTSSAVKDDFAGVLQINLVYTPKSGPEVVVGGGSGFLISDSYVMTCYHVVNFDESYENYDLVKEYYGDEFDPSNVKIQVVVMDDVVREATLTTSYSDINDFAILQLREPIYGRTPLVLGKQDTVVETDNVYALGFPDKIAEFQNTNTYDESDVSLTDGKVNKFITKDGANYIQHSAQLTNGSSGGPLVNDDGVVVGLNKGLLTDTGYYFSVSMDRIISVLDANNIPYTLATGTEQVPEQTDAQIEEKNTQASEEDAATAAETKAKDKDDDDDDEDDDKSTSVKPSSSIEDPDNSNILIYVAIGAVVLVVIVIIIIIIVATSGKKKSVPTGPISTIPQNPGYASRPQAPMGGNGGYVPPAAPAAPTYGGSSEGAGETTVLNEGAGETTVLGGGAAAAVRVVIRVKNGERINVSKPEFLLGKERVRVDYCISNNNSVSRTHAKLLNRNGQLSIIDMNATNGTYVNGSKLTPNKEVVLKSGDRFKLADEEFQVQ